LSWTPVIAKADLPDGKVHVLTTPERRVAVCHAGGEVYAIEDVCTHDGASLDQGELLGCEIECPRHGARFDVTTGRALTLPAVRPVRTFPVRVTSDGMIEVEVS
jgi:3-phenylpropionate/trans-cinnamate dioxygenase ferredoxin component